MGDFFKFCGLLRKPQLYVNESCDFTKKFALQFHKFSHQSKILQIHVQKVNVKPQNWRCEISIMIIVDYKIMISVNYKSIIIVNYKIIIIVSCKNYYNCILLGSKAKSWEKSARVWSVISAILRQFQANLEQLITYKFERLHSSFNNIRQV